MMSPCVRPDVLYAPLPVRSGSCVALLRDDALSHNRSCAGNRCAPSVVVAN